MVNSMKQLNLFGSDYQYLLQCIKRTERVFKQNALEENIDIAIRIVFDYSTFAQLLNIFQISKREFYETIKKDYKEIQL